MSIHLETFQKFLQESQRQLSEDQMFKIEEMNSDACVFKHKGNEEQSKINTKLANKIKDAKSLLSSNPENNMYDRRNLEHQRRFGFTYASSEVN